MIKLLGRYGLVLGCFINSLVIHSAVVDPTLKPFLKQSQDHSLQDVLVTFDQSHPVTNNQLRYLSDEGMTGNRLTDLPMVLVKATAAQIKKLIMREDVASIWCNEWLEFESIQHYESSKSSVKELSLLQRLQVSLLDSEEQLKKHHENALSAPKKVSVLLNDSGIDITHQDLSYPKVVRQNLIIQPQLSSYSNIAPLTMQSSFKNTDIGAGHGTLVAGVLSGNGSLSAGKHKGIVPETPIISIGSGNKKSLFDALAGMDYALQQRQRLNIRVVLNAFGSRQDMGTPLNISHPMTIATKRLSDRGIITVFSAGNEGNKAGSLTGSYKKAPWVITVAAATSNKQIAAFSSYGTPVKSQEIIMDDRRYFWQDQPTIAAPGQDQISLRASLSSLSALSLRGDSQQLSPELIAHYTQASGTSLSAAYVSGVIATMLDKNPELSGEQIKTILQSTAEPIEQAETWQAGAGLINKKAAIEAASSKRAFSTDTDSLEFSSR